MARRLAENMELMEQQMPRDKSARVPVRGKSAEAPGQRKKALGLKSARSLASGRTGGAGGSTAPRRATKGAGLPKRTYPRGTQS